MSVKSKYVLLKGILKNDDIYNPIYTYKVMDIDTLEKKELTQGQINSLIKNRLVVNCSEAIK